MLRDKLSPGTKPGFLKSEKMLEFMFWEILQKLAELHNTEDVLVTFQDGILKTQPTREDGRLQSDDN